MDIINGFITKNSKYKTTRKNTRKNTRKPARKNNRQNNQKTSRKTKFKYEIIIKKSKQTRTPNRYDIVSYSNKYDKNVIHFLMNSYKNVKIPMVGFLNINFIRKIHNNGIVYLLLEKNIITGIFIFKNTTLSEKQYYFNKNIDKILNKKDINIYQFIYALSIYTDKINTKLFRNLLARFQNDMNLSEKNCVLTIYKYLELENNKFHDMFERYKKYNELIMQNKYDYLGFKKNGMHFNIHDELIESYVIRFFKKEITVKDFNNTYIITRQIENNDAINLSYLVNSLENNNYWQLNNVSKYFISSSFMYYAPSKSINNSVPYENLSIMSFLSNKLANIHIISHYGLLYYAIKTYLSGKNDKHILDKFVPVYMSKNEALKNYHKKSSFSFEKILLSKQYFYTGFFDRIKLKPNNLRELNNTIEIINSSNLLFVLKDYTMHKHNRLNLKNKLLYYISPYVMYTYINNEFNAYVFNKSAFYIFNPDKQSSQAYLDTVFFPDNFNTYADEFINTDYIQLKIRELVATIAKMFHNHVNTDNNQINGFYVHNYYLIITKSNKNDSDKYDIMLSQVDQNIYFPNYTDNLHNYIVNEYLEWINELVIKPNLISNYKTNKTDLHYKPVY